VVAKVGDEVLELSLRYCKKDDTTQKSIDKAKFISAMWAMSGNLGGMYTAGVLSDDILSLSYPWIRQVLGSQSTMSGY
jgi:hypothetical protein